MSNDYWNPSGNPGQGSGGISSLIRTEFANIAAGFAKLCGLSGNANKAVVVNSGATGLSITTGTFALAGNFATVGAHSLTVTLTADSSITMPTSGTLVAQGGALGTPSSGVATNLTGTAAGLSIGGNAATATTATSATTATTATNLSGGSVNATSVNTQTDFRLQNTETEPATLLVGAFTIYVDVVDSKLKAKASSGTVTILASP